MSLEIVNDEDTMLWKWKLPTRILSNPEVVRGDDDRTFVFHPSTSFGCVGIVGTSRLSEDAIHCFEVEFYPPYFGEARAVGVGSKQTILHYKHRIDRHANMNTYESLVGLDENSWGLNYDGYLLHRKTKKQFFDKSEYDSDSPLRVRVTYDGCSKMLLYHVNDKNLGVAFVNIDRPVYPMVCSSGRETHVKLLWHKSFAGSLQSMCRSVIRTNIKIGSLDKLPLPPHLIAFLNFD